VLRILRSGNNNDNKLIIIIGLIIMSHGNVYGAVIMTKVIARVLVNAAD